MPFDKVRGRFVWHELMTTDPAAALLLYPRVVGWEVRPSPQDPSYTLLLLGGIPRAGVLRLPEEAIAINSPPSWTCYVGTPDVDATARQAEALGGRVLRSPTEIAGLCRFTILQDPQGALFAAFQPLAEPLPDAPPAHGDFAWHELASTDSAAAFAFYEALFGWRKTEAMDMGPLGTYQMFGNGGASLGGMYSLPRDLEIPSHWLPYARVTDAQRAAAAMEAGGGRVSSAPMQIPSGDWVAKMVDPQGAVFAVHSSDATTTRELAPKTTTASRGAGTNRKAPPAMKRPAAARHAAKQPAGTAARKPAASRAKPGTARPKTARAKAAVRPAARGQGEKRAAAAKPRPGEGRPRAASAKRSVAVRKPAPARRSAKKK